jgi:hypothetical protein
MSLGSEIRDPEKNLSRIQASKKHRILIRNSGENSHPGSGTVKIRIRDKHPGSATLLPILINDVRESLFQTIEMEYRTEVKKQN